MSPKPACSSHALPRSAVERARARMRCARAPGSSSRPWFCLRSGCHRIAARRYARRISSWLRAARPSGGTRFLTKCAWAPDTDPDSTASRPCIGPLHRPVFDPASTLFRPRIDPALTSGWAPDGWRVNPGSTLNRPRADPGWTPDRPSKMEPPSKRGSAQHGPRFDPRIDHGSTPNRTWIRPLHLLYAD